jgi:LPXTG-motif cell wall-anchored protein
MVKKLLIAAAVLALMVGGGFGLASPASAASVDECVPVAYQPAVAPTYANQVVTPYQPAVYEIVQTQYQHVVVEPKPAVPAVYDFAIWGFYRDGSGVLPDQFFRSDPGFPWVLMSTANLKTLRHPEIPAVDEVVETRIIETRALVSPEVLEVRADVEVTPGSPEVAGVVCPGTGLGSPPPGPVLGGPEPELPLPEAPVETPVETPVEAPVVALSVSEVSHLNATQPAAQRKQLPRTGVDEVLPLAIAGLFLITAGSIVIAARRRRV